MEVDSHGGGFKTDAELQAWGEANGIPPRPGETMDTYRVRVRDVYECRQREKQQ